MYKRQPPESASEKTVHPLEALYKRRKDGPPKPAPIDTSFSFFDNEDKASDAGSATAEPRTPHMRTIRSAAPTPDTAAIGRRFSFSFPDEVDPDEVEDEDLDETTIVGTTNDTSADKTPQPEQSEFARTFRQRRKEYNDMWKSRRREVKKTERQIENRRLSRRAA